MTDSKINKILVDFVEAVNLIDFSSEVKARIIKLIEVKRAGREKEIIFRDAVLDTLIETFLSDAMAVSDGHKSLGVQRRQVIADRIFKRALS